MISLNVPHKLYLILSTVKLLTVAFKLLGITCFCLYKLVIIYKNIHEKILIHKIWHIYAIDYIQFESWHSSVVIQVCQVGNCIPTWHRYILESDKL